MIFVWFLLSFVSTSITEGGSRFYIGSTEKVDYSTAISRCSSGDGITLNGGQLATFSNDEEFRKIVDIRNEIGEEIWIGLDDLNDEGKWRFIDGDSTFCDNYDGTDCDNIPQWAVGEPNSFGDGQDCGRVWSHYGGSIDDYYCNTQYRYVCEFDTNIIIDAYASETGSTSKFYIVSNDKANYANAKAKCLQGFTFGGGQLAQLATFGSDAEFRKIVKIRDVIGENAWFGLNDLSDEGKWRFIDSDSSFCDNYDGTDCDNIPQWAVDEPNSFVGGQDCARVWNAKDRQNKYGSIDDFYCNNKLPFICETWSNLIVKSHVDPVINNNNYYILQFGSIKDIIIWISILLNLVIFPCICYSMIIKRKTLSLSNYSKVNAYSDVDSHNEDQVEKL